jgi:hypothetical protein
VPRCIGGRSDQIVTLTAREHFIAHWLLTKMFDASSVEHRKMMYAFCMLMKFKGGGKSAPRRSRLFTECRKRLADLTAERGRGRRASPEARRKMSIARKGVKFTEEHKRKIAEKSRGKTPSSETREKIRQSTIRQMSTQASRDAVSRVHKGKTISHKHRRITSEANKERWRVWRDNGSYTSQETRDKIRAAKQGKPNTLPKEAVDQFIERAKQPKSPEHRRRISESVKKSLAIKRERAAKGAIDREVSSC